MEAVTVFESADASSRCADTTNTLTESMVDIICLSPASPESDKTNASGKHRRRSRVTTKGSVSCARCSVTFSSNTNLNKHIRAFHPGSIKCEICDQPVLTDADQHLRSVHDITLNYTKLIFNNEVDFQLWKVEEEKRSGAQYVSTSGTKKTPACVAKRYFICRRSGKFQPHNKNTQSECKKKSRASVRCGVKCPARMTLTVDHSGKYLVDYQETHYGHDRDSTPDQVGDGSEIKRLRRKYSQRSDCETQPVLSECMQPVQQSEHPDGDLVDSEHSHKKSPRSVRSSSSSGPLHYLESLWELRNSEGFQNFSNRLHMHFDRKNGVLLVSEVGVVMSGIMRPCFLSSLLFYESRPPSIYVRGVELLPETFQVGDIRSETGFFGLLCAVLNAPKCPGVADQADVFFDNANGYIDTTCRWRHENCSIFSSGGHECDGCASLRKLFQQAKQDHYNGVTKRGDE